MTATDLSHRFGDSLPLFSNLTFQWQAGEIVALIGPSGSGKSTLLSILGGMTKPSTGTVSIKHSSGIVWVPQNPYGVPSRSALDLVVYPLLAGGATRRDAEPVAMTALREFGLADNAGQRFKELSGGQAQRLMLARASLTKANLFLVDEPSAQLDPSNARSVIESLHHLRGVGRLVVIATHDPRVVAVCSKVLDLGES